MHTLKVQGIPNKLYSRLTALARANQMSLDAQVITLLNRALQQETHRQEQAQILAQIRQHRFTAPPGAPGSTEMIRQDRLR